MHRPPPFPRPRPLVFFSLGLCGWAATVLLILRHPFTPAVEDTVAVLAMGVALIVVVAAVCSGTLARRPVHARWIVPMLALGGLASLPIAGPLLLLPHPWQAMAVHVPPLFAAAALGLATVLPYIASPDALLPIWERALGRIPPEEAAEALRASVDAHRFSRHGEGAAGWHAIWAHDKNAVVPLTAWIVGTDQHAGSDTWMAFMQQRLGQDMDKALAWRLPPRRPVYVGIAPPTAHQRLAAAARHAESSSAAA